MEYLGTNNDNADLVRQDEIPSILKSKSITVEAPNSTEEIGLFVAVEDITLLGVRGWVEGSSTPSVDFNIGHGSNPTSLTDLYNVDETIDETTDTNAILTGFNSQSVTAGDAVKLLISATSGTVDAVHLTLIYQ